jgi:hypothetical protein
MLVCRDKQQGEEVRRARKSQWPGSDTLDAGSGWDLPERIRQDPPDDVAVECRTRLGGLLQHYERRAA